MSSWAGFSDEELRRLQQKDSAMVRGRKPAQAGRNRQQLQRERALQLSAQKNSVSPGLPPEQQLAKPPPKVACQPSAEPATPAVAGDDKPKTCEGILSECLHQAAEERTSSEVKELEKQEVELREKTRLEQLQQEQKIMEERNRQKKALLTKTIAEKSKQTQAEAVKLKRIQKELQALDDMVSNDIGILRGRIEEASWDYTAARKRYEKAETEYVTAKLDLHKKTEVKEQLTEHLCAIIQQNELRKAHKLEELMKQLHLLGGEEEAEEGTRQEEMRQQETGREKTRQEEERGTQEEERGTQEEEKGTQAEVQRVCEASSSEEQQMNNHSDVLDSQSVATGDVKLKEEVEREESERTAENDHQSEGGSSL